MIRSIGKESGGICRVSPENNIIASEREKWITLLNYELKFNNEHCAQVHRQEQFTASVKFTIMITSVVAYHRYAINCASEDLDSRQWHSSQTYVGVLVLGDLFRP